MARVTLENLVKNYAGKNGEAVRAVNGINLEIKDGEFMVLVGPSGCGKSTTLRMIAGLEAISGGSIRIGDAVVNAVLPKDRDIAMVFQNYALYPHMTVYENLAFGLRQRHFPKPEIDARVREAAALLGIADLLDRRPKALSGGQRQRVAVGRAIVRKPKVFLFDEPLSNLDAKMRVSMRAEIAKLHRRLGATMIYVTHDQVEAMTMGDRICVMKDGDIMQVAEPLTVYDRPANLFVAGFIGSPPTNFISGTVQRGANGTAEFRPAAAGASALPLPESLARRAAAHMGSPMILGIRPEDIADASPSAEGSGQLEARIEVAEPMGAETYLHLVAAGVPLVARMRPSPRFQPGHAIRIAPDLGRAHLFDPQTQQVLGS